MSVEDIPRKIILRTSIKDFEIEIVLMSFDDLEEAFIQLSKARSRLEHIKEKHRLLDMAETVRETAAAFWIEDNNMRKLKTIEDKPKGIHLVLLDAYQDCKKISEIVSSTGYARTTIERYSKGSLGSFGSSFEECDDGWRLTEQGLQVITDMLDIHHRNDSQINDGESD